MTPTGTVALTTEVVPFTAGDGMKLNLHRIRGPHDPWRGPVILSPGAGVRANLFRPPEAVTIVDALVADGWDVWLENWRASIDLPRNPWDLDQAAVLDHPPAVACIVEHTGADTVKALIHCQGSSSLALAAVAGLLPQVDTIVANAMSLHPVVPAWSRFKITQVVPRVASAIPYLDPQWGDTPPDRFLERAMVAAVKATHRECHNGACRMISFAYGSGHPALWAHENLSARTHQWIRTEFGPVPMTFFQQMAASIRAGRLMPTGRFHELPADPLGAAPQTDARFALIAGEHNRCFLPASQRKSFEYLDSHRPGYHRLHIVHGYGHLDIFLGRYAARDVFPLLLEELKS